MSKEVPTPAEEPKQPKTEEGFVTPGEVLGALNLNNPENAEKETERSEDADRRNAEQLLRVVREERDELGQAIVGSGGAVDPEIRQRWHALDRELRLAEAAEAVRTHDIPHMRDIDLRVLAEEAGPNSPEAAELRARGDAFILTPEQEQVNKDIRLAAHLINQAISEHEQDRER